MTDKIIKIDPNFKNNGGCAGYFSWTRLESILRMAGELRTGETIEGLRLDDAGCNFYVKKDLTTDKS